MHSALRPAGPPSADRLPASRSSPASACPRRSAAAPSHHPCLHRAPPPAHSAGLPPATVPSSAPRAASLLPAHPAPCAAAHLLLRPPTMLPAPALSPPALRLHPVRFAD